MTQAEFEDQWKPRPGEDFSPPACREGLILLKAFAETHPSTFALLRPEDFIHFEIDDFRGLEAWEVFATHCRTCPDCNEV